MLDKVIANTNEYLEAIPKSERKKYGQFFTSKETAEYMSGMFKGARLKGKVRCLDPGAGSGILACALIRYLNGVDAVEEIDFTCYENDIRIIDLLKENVEICKKGSSKKVSFTVKAENYITSQYLEFNDLLGAKESPEKYDLIIGNPPYLKIARDSIEASAMQGICYGAPNLYFLFAAMSMFNLVENGEMVYIVPRSWTSGAYFKSFREYFLSHGKLEHIHLFVSRNKVFEKENVLQETMIMKLKKTTSEPKEVLISSSVSNADFSNTSTINVPYPLVVSGTDKYVYLTTTRDEIDVLNRVRKFPFTLPEIGLRMKTGLTVDFRNREELRDVKEDGAIPLFFSQHIQEGNVLFPINKTSEYIVTSQPGLIQDNKNYLFVKRFTAKEERRRLQCGVYLAKSLPEYSKISTQNKINFIDGVETEISECLVYGLYVLFNSTLYDLYYRILNGSTQVNSTEINTIPVPDLDTIQDMGRELIRKQDLSEEMCNLIMEEYCV